MKDLDNLNPLSPKAALEALLLVSSDPVSASALAQAIDITPGECASLLAELKVEYEEAERGFQLREVAGGWRLFTHPAYHDQVESFVLSWTPRSFRRPLWRRSPSLRTINRSRVRR